MRSINILKSAHVVGLLLMLFMPLVARAQVAGGAISGKVIDSNGAVLPGAQVTIRNKATDVATDLVANEEGVYRAPNLLPGDYEVTATATNFNTVVQKGVVLTVGADLTIDLQLQPGGVGMTVVVRDEPPSVDTTTPTSSSGWLPTINLCSCASLDVAKYTNLIQSSVPSK